MAEVDMGKQRLRPFLEAQINSGKIDGLRWLNESYTKFRIPWWHGGKPDWNPERGQIFKVRSNWYTQPFYGPLSRTTRVSRYQKKLPLTLTYPDHQLSFMSFLHLL